MSQTKSQRLRRLAEPLKPERPPWYVRVSDLGPGLERTFPADGWYWVPAGFQTAIYLGNSAGVAEHELRGRIADLEREGAPA